MLKLFMREPEFFPHLDFFHGLVNSEVWVVLDHLRYRSRTKQNLCRIKTPSGIQILRVAVKYPSNKPIYQIMINNYVPWKRFFLLNIKRSYEKAPFYDEYIDDLRSIVQGPSVMLETFNVQATMWIASLMKVYPQLYYTHFSYEKYPKKKTIDAVCNKLKADLFAEKFNHPFYQQLREPFEKDLSILDSLFCIGADETRKMLEIKQG